MVGASFVSYAFIGLVKSPVDCWHWEMLEESDRLREAMVQNTATYQERIRALEDELRAVLARHDDERAAARGAADERVADERAIVLRLQAELEDERRESRDQLQTQVQTGHGVEALTM